MLRKPYFFIPMCVLSAVAMPICGMDEDIKNESIEESQKPKENGPQSLQHQVALGLSKALSDFLNQNKQQISNIIDNKKSTTLGIENGKFIFFNSSENKKNTMNNPAASSGVSW